MTPAIMGRLLSVSSGRTECLKCISLALFLGNGTKAMSCIGPLCRCTRDPSPTYSFPISVSPLDVAIAFQAVLPDSLWAFG